MHQILKYIRVLLFLSIVPSYSAVPFTAQSPFSFSPIVKKTAPAIVSISSTQAISMPRSLFNNDPFFNFFFGLTPNTPESQQFQQRTLAKSLGSGVIVDPAGIVVTCVHVVDDAKNIRVTLNDNREFDGEIIAKDAQNDLVAIQLKNVPFDTSLPAIPLEKSDVEVGDIIIAIGNPFGVGQTVTSGIVSAIAREVRGRILIQTDASINPGNSGGALISMNGKLVAIPNAILSRTGASQGIGFAIPQTMVQSLLDSVKTGGEIIHPWTGIKLQRITSDMASSLNMDIPKGALVSSLHSASPALSAGLTQGDIITHVNDLPVATPEEFTYRLQAIPLTQPIVLSILRNGQPFQISFYAIIPPEVPPADERMIPPAVGLLGGLKVANLSPAAASKYQLPLEIPETGVIITDVGGNLLAQEIQLKPGDLIEALNHQPVGSVNDLFNQLPNLQGEVSITIRHGNRRIEVRKNL